jgi:2-polyprenyl-3-methyl-5-hydroxy-6-metoxy-1,4-benzoquinol methylase
MRRIIEELVEKRKSQQENFRKSLQELGNLIEKRSLFKKNKLLPEEKLNEIYTNLTELITTQDREWDAYSNNHSTQVFKSLQWKIEKLEAEYSNVKTLLINFINLEKSLENIIQKIEENTKPDKPTLDRLKDIKSQLSVYQYSDFEQRFRGDEKDVLDKLRRYLPIFTHSTRILDIGCGRGEFLNLLKQEGKEAEGIDISESMLTIAREKGLNITKIEALEFLENQKENSYGGIFSSQVIEHFQPDYLRSVILESFRVLEDGAPIVLETVNPLSVFALSNIYFLDVTHQKPLHPEYMRYLLESSGFSNVHISYSEELKEEKLEEIGPDNQIARQFNSNVDKLNKILFSSPAYAVIGTKKWKTSEISQ